VELVKEDGRVYISSTMINGEFTLRYAGVTHRTHRDTVDLLLEILATVATRAEREILLAPATQTVVP
jgi:aromatic-L-amino-acid decarboxylase